MLALLCYLPTLATALMEMLKPLLHGQQQQADEILSIEEVSKLIGKKKEQVYQWVNNSKYGLGDLPYLKAGRSLRFSKNAILQWKGRARDEPTKPIDSIGRPHR